MMSNSEIEKKVEATIDSVDFIEHVNVSPFLKDRILNQLSSRKEETDTAWSWFTSAIQLATLVLFIALNVYAYFNLNQEEYNSTIDEFAETYDLSEETDSSIFN